jgi:single-strand DNA-binding protein
MLNKIMFIGRLVKDPELRYTKTSNIPVAGFSVAVPRRAKKDQEPVVDFIPVVAWQSRALFVSRYFKQGQPICIDGRLQQVSWVDKTTGDTRYSFEVIADEVYFAGFKKDQTAGAVAEEELDPYAEDMAPAA